MRRTKHRKPSYLQIRVFLFAISILFVTSFIHPNLNFAEANQSSWWQIQSIDTMKFSRDLAREKENDLSFQSTINQQVKNISETGATHVAIGTPYDDEFYPYLKRWVDAARRYKLKVWFRGNFSGWEKWFGYKGISREEHTRMTKDFILNHKDLFEDDDIFSSCPECENGGPGDPRLTRDIIGHRNFLIKDYQTVSEAFKKIGKNVNGNYYSMNGDVAKLIMDKKTTAQLGGIVTIDHYVPTPDQLVSDIEEFARLSGGKIFLGEIGAPIPDLHGNLNEDQQAEYISETMKKLVKVDSLIGMNYWVSEGGSTQLWKEGIPRKAVASIREYFIPHTVFGTVMNEINTPIKNAIITSKYKMSETDNKGNFSIPLLSDEVEVQLKASGYVDKIIPIVKSESRYSMILQKENENFIFKILKFLNKVF